MAAHTVRYARHTETTMNAYEFENVAAVTLSRFLARFKWGWDLKRIFEGTAWWIMPKFVKDRPRYSLTVWNTPHRDKIALSRLPKVGEEQIYAYVKAVRFLIKYYASDSIVPKETSVIACLTITTKETSVQFLYLTWKMVVRCRNVCFQKRTKTVFIRDILANIHSAVRISWVLKKGAKLLGIFQCAEPLREQTRQVLSSVVASCTGNYLLKECQKMSISSSTQTHGQSSKKHLLCHEDNQWKLH